MGEGIQATHKGEENCEGRLTFHKGAGEKQMAGRMGSFGQARTLGGCSLGGRVIAIPYLGEGLLLNFPLLCCMQRGV